MAERIYAPDALQLRRMRAAVAADIHVTRRAFDMGYVPYANVKAQLTIIFNKIKQEIPNVKN